MRDAEEVLTGGDNLRQVAEQAVALEPSLHEHPSVHVRQVGVGVILISETTCNLLILLASPRGFEPLLPP